VTRRAILAIWLAFFLGVTGISCAAAEKFVTIGTAGELGVYYPAGGAICRFIKRGSREHGIHCLVQATSGSVYNLKALQDDTLNLAIAQTDWIFHALHGTQEFAHNKADTELRTIFTLHTEAFTVLARDGSGIGNVRDLRGKRIGIGYDGSGMRATAEEFIAAEGWNAGSFAAMIPLKAGEQAAALCSGKIDALLSTTGHPNGGMQEITSRCKTNLIAVEGPEIVNLLKKNPYYVNVVLPGGMYAGTQKPTATFGVKAALVTTSRMSDEVIYQIVKAVFDNLDNFKTLHPVFSTLDKNAMATQGIVAPLHPGALRYFKENGLIQ
jgi:TRAP transporter TAXI family solute receptor